VKFGLWTFLALNLGFSLYFGPPWDQQALWDYWGIIITHLGFVAEAYLIPNYGKTTTGALAAALVVSLGSDVLDYGFGYHPPLRYEVGLVLPLITVALSFVSVFAASHAMERLDD
ncbi:DUF1405 domain-containing protein, partial [Haladaptatus sp. W1]